MSAPTKEAIIGTFINGRNAQDDFLQLASNRGGTVFAWIDYLGNLQGTFANTGVTSLNSLTGAVTLAAGTNVTLVPSGNTLTINSTSAPGGSNTDVQFNNSGVFGGDPTFTWDNVGKVLSFINSAAATAIVSPVSPALEFMYNRWAAGTGPSTATTWTIQAGVSTIGGTNAATLFITPSGTGSEQTAVNIVGSLAVGTFLYLPNNSEIAFGTSTNITGGVPGNIDIANGNSTLGDGSISFSRAIAPASRPAIFARSGSTILHFRTADDSADIGITAASFNGLTTPAASGSAVVAQTIASGTATLGTTLIASGAAATTVTVSASGVLTTDTLMADFNADPTAVTGYAPSASGMLTIIKFPTAGGVNFIVVNNTGSSITPGAITLNWRVVR